MGIYLAVRSLLSPAMSRAAPDGRPSLREGTRPGAVSLCVRVVGFVNPLVSLALYVAIGLLSLLSDYPTSTLSRQLVKVSPLFHGYGGVTQLLPLGFGTAAIAQLVMAIVPGCSSQHSTRPRKAGLLLMRLVMLIQYAALPLLLLWLADCARQRHVQLNILDRATRNV